jgi:hypothetical protein
MKYIVLVGCESSKKRFEPGDTVTSKDFPADVIKDWVKIGVLDPAEKEVTNGPREE